MLVEAVWIIAGAPVGGPPARLDVGDTVRLGTEHAEEGLGHHGARANLHVIRFLDDAAPLRPVVFQFENDLLKRLHG